jgi:hypothetical protein
MRYSNVVKTPYDAKRDREKTEKEAPSISPMAKASKYTKVNSHRDRGRYTATQVTENNH